MLRINTAQLTLVLEVYQRKQSLNKLRMLESISHLVITQQKWNKSINTTRNARDKEKMHLFHKNLKEH